MTENQEVIALGVTDAAIQTLQEKWGGIEWDCSDKQTYDEVKQGIGEIRGLRGKVEKRRTDLKRPLLDQGRMIDAEAKRIIGLLQDIETPLKQAKELEDMRAEREHQELLLKEQRRQERITDKIQSIERAPISLHSSTADEVQVARDILAKTDLADCEERIDVAQETLQNSLAIMDRMILDKRAAEQARKDLAELERLRAENKQREQQAEASIEMMSSGSAVQEEVIRRAPRIDPGKGDDRTGVTVISPEERNTVNVLTRYTGSVDAAQRLAHAIRGGLIPNVQWVEDIF